MSDKQPVELGEIAEFLNNLRTKAFVGFVTALMVLYSFFGNIYRIPMQLEIQHKDIATMEADIQSNVKRLNDVEKLLATKEELFLDISRQRVRIEALERTVTAQVSMQQQLDRLERVTGDLAKLLDSTATKLTELNITVGNIKEVTVENKRVLEEVKRRAP